MKNRETVYVCDICKKKGQQFIDWNFRFHFVAGPPKGWKSLGRNTHICDECRAAIERLKKEKENAEN